MVAVSRLVLTHFRNLEGWEVSTLPAAGVVALVGPNGVGKTSVLEALSLLDGGRGLVGDEAKAMVRDGAEREGFTVFAEVQGSRDKVQGSLGLQYRQGAKSVRVDGVEAKVEELAKVVTVVSLAPEVDRMFYEAPAGRRAQVDAWAAMVDKAHGEAVERFALHAKNRLKILLQGGAVDWLEAEEYQAAVWGAKMLAGRAAYVAALGPYLDGLKVALAGASVEVLAAGDPVAALKGKLERSREIDVRLERTSAGPNTVDVSARLRVTGDGLREEWVVAKQSSSGQHKRVMLRWLCGQVRLLGAAGVHPLVLVDELGAHLDAAGKVEALEALASLGVQVWVSDTEMLDVSMLDVRRVEMGSES